MVSQTRSSTDVISNPGIFCNAPWYELNIYWDGGLGICCHESERPHPAHEVNRYNIANMSIAEWYNSKPIKNLRTRMLGDQPLQKYCQRCIFEEQHTNTSRRHKSNQKSVIFTRSAFAESFQQSPHYDKFVYSAEHNGETITVPVDFHIDLGNYCNLACKMCKPEASSSIASQHVQWGIASDRKFLGNDWTRNQAVWDRFLDELLTIPVKNIHFMGGETLITKRFHDFLDFMILHKRFDLNLSFVTNGTMFDAEIMQKLSKFQRIGIEISIETMTAHNSYQRQSTDTNLVIENLKQYQQWCDNQRISLTIRPAISALSIGYYHTLLEFCLTNQFVVKSLIVTDPEFLQVAVLPTSVRQQYISKYTALAKRYNLTNIDLSVDFNESDPNQIQRIVKTHIDQAINLLNQPDADQQLQQQMVDHCSRWDQVYHYNAIELYPELTELFSKHGYKTLSS